MAALYNAPPANTVAVMLLVDNNHFTKIAWSDLRDQCLPALFSRLSSVHPSALITTFVQESCSTNSDQTLIEIPPAHREYYAYQDAIRDVRFNSTMSCRLTVPLINGAIQFLTSTVSIARHIIIIGSSSVHNVYSSHNDNWHRLAQSLALGSIYCHLMLHASTVSPTEPLNLLFDESLRLQKMAEDKPWFSNNRSLIIPRLSLVRSPVPQVPLEVASPMIDPGPVSLPLSLERNISPTSIRPMYPQAPSASSEEEALPSLVTQLQQMHGLTKKKVYGTKPKRRPFVSAEVYREHPRKASSLSPVLPSDTNHGGRVTSPSLIDRASRVSQNGTPLSHSSALRSMSDVGPSTSSSELDPSRILQNGALLSRPGASRSMLDVRTSSSPTELDPVSSYLPPTIPVSSPASSPILNHAPPSWNPSMSPPQSGYQQYPAASAPHVHTLPRSGNYPVDHHSVGKLPALGLLDPPPITDGGASSPHNDHPYLKTQVQNLSTNTTANYSSHPSLYYRNEELSHRSSDHHFTQGPSFSTSYSQNTQIIDNSSPLSQSGHWNYDAVYASQQQTSNQNSMTSGHSATSSHPPSPGSSSSSSLTGWAG